MVGHRSRRAAAGLAQLLAKKAPTGRMQIPGELVPIPNASGCVGMRWDSKTGAHGCVLGAHGRVLAAHGRVVGAIGRVLGDDDLVFAAPGRVMVASWLRPSRTCSRPCRT